MQPARQLIWVAIAHSTPDLEEQVDLFTRRRVGIGTKVRGLNVADMDGQAQRHMRLLERLAHEGGVAVITLCEIRMLGLVKPQGPPEETERGLFTVQVTEWRELPSELRAITSMGSAICELTGRDAALVTEAAIAFGWS